jgi:hypothetical protein
MGSYLRPACTPDFSLAVSMATSLFFYTAGYAGATVSGNSRKELTLSGVFQTLQGFFRRNKFLASAGDCLPPAETQNWLTAVSCIIW